MRKLVLKLCFWLLFCLQGCHPNNSWTFKHEISLKGSEIESSQILDPIDLIVYDSLLFVKEPLRGNKCLKIISLNNFNLITDAAYIGRGAGELTNPGPIVIDKANKFLWISDWGKNRCYKYLIDSLITDTKYKPSESFKINTKLLPMMNVFNHPSGSLGFSCYYLQENLISFIDFQGELIEKRGIPNTVFPNIWDNNGYSDNPILIHYNPSQNKIVVAARYENKIAVIDDQGKISFKLETSIQKTKMRTREIAWSGKYYTFYSIDSDENFIYCLYIGGYAFGWNKRSKLPITNYPSRLMVFDWNGEKKYEIQLDHGIVFSALDEKREQYIGSSENAVNGLVTYDLSLLYNSIR